MKFNRAKLDGYYKQADKFFKALSKIEPRLAEYFADKDPSEVCSRYRTAAGGSVYFWPIGLALMTELAMSLRSAKGPEWQDWMAALPKRMEEAPFAGTIWSYRQTIDPKGRILCRDILLHMCGVGESSATALRDRLRVMSGDDGATVPRRLKL